MKVTRIKNQIIIEHLDDFLAEMLRRIPASAVPGDNKAAGERLFTKPEATDGKLAADWKLYVEPELRHLFQSALETVADDLKKIRKIKSEEEGDEYGLKIPLIHVDAWLNATNQARLVLSAIHEFADEELAGEIPVTITNSLELALFQVHFYGFLQECFLRILE